MATVGKARRGANHHRPPARTDYTSASPERTAALTAGVRMRENPAEWAFVRLSKLIQDFEKGLDRDE